MNNSHKEFFISLMRRDDKILLAYPSCRKIAAFTDIYSNSRIIESEDNYIFVIESPENSIFINPYLKPDGIIDNPAINREIINKRVKLFRFQEFDYGRTELFYGGAEHIFSLCINKSTSEVSLLHNNYEMDMGKDSFILKFSAGSLEPFLKCFPCGRNNRGIFELNYLNGLYRDRYSHKIITAGKDAGFRTMSCPSLFFCELYERLQTRDRAEDYFNTLVFSEKSLFQKIRSLKY